MSRGDIIVASTPETRGQVRAWQVVDDGGNAVTLWLPDRSRCWSYFTITAARSLVAARGGRMEQSATRSIKDTVVTWKHDCGTWFDGAPPQHCIDPAAHRNYRRPESPAASAPSTTAARPAPIGGGGNLTGAQLEDGAAAIARTFNSIGIQADPGRFGGAVLYPTREQALVILGLLEQARAVVAAPAEGPGDAR